MIQKLTNGEILPETRPGWEIACPSCSGRILYTVLNISPEIDAYLYCDSCNSFVLREEDRRKLLTILNDNAGHEREIKISAFYERLERDLPNCTCGGNFSLWSNVKCPSCGYKFPYNQGIQSLETRRMESKLIWMRGAVAYRGSFIPSNNLVTVELS